MATFYNRATLSYNGTVKSSNITSGEIIEVLSAEKSAVSESYSQGSENVYLISLVNTGSTCYSGLTVTDDLGAYSFGEENGMVVPLTYREGSLIYYVNGVRQPAPEVTGSSPLTITGINVPAGGNALIVYAASANSCAPMGNEAVITNTAVISGAGFESITALADVSYMDGIDLTISKSLSPAAVEENGEVTYTFIIRNFGTAPAEAGDNVIFTDIFTPSLNGITAEFNGAPWVSGENYTYDPCSGEFNSLAGQLTVPAASFTQDEATGEWSAQAGSSALVIKGRIASV